MFKVLRFFWSITCVISVGIPRFDRSCKTLTWKCECDLNDTKLSVHSCSLQNHHSMCRNCEELYLCGTDCPAEFSFMCSLYDESECKKVCPTLDDCPEECLPQFEEHSIKYINTCKQCGVPPPSSPPLFPPPFSRKSIIMASAVDK